MNIPYGEEMYTFMGLLANTTYFFKIYPYTNSNEYIDYKTDGTPPEDNATTANLSTINSEDFESNTLGTWSEYSVTGEQVWYVDDFSGNHFAKMSGYSGGPQPNDDWLISPPLNMDNYVNETLTFLTASNYDGPVLEVKISTDYDGMSDPYSATWTDLVADLSPGGWAWTESGNVDISGFNGTSVYVAYKYTSTDSEAATWEVDDILIVGEPTQVNIAGSFNGWNPNDPDYQMFINANNVWELNKNLDGFNEYKAVDGGDWYPPNNNQIIDLTEPTDITWKANIEYNLVTHTLPVVAGSFFDDMGLGNDWDPANLNGEMEDPEGDDVYTLELLVPAGVWDFKVTFNHNWDQSTTANNITFTSDGSEATLFTYIMATNETSASGPAPEFATITFVVDETMTGTADAFYLKGSWSSEGFYDINWNNGEEHGPFYDDGTHGDEVAGDHIWTTQQELVVDGGSNTWHWGFNNSNHGWAAGGPDFMIIDNTPQTLTYTINDPVADLILTEIMYNPPESGSDTLEFLELYNRGADPVDLPEFFFSAGVTFTFPYTDETLEPGGFVLVAEKADAMWNFFGVEAYQWEGALSNSGEKITVNDKFGRIVNTVTYDDAPPWPTEPDNNGPSLVFCEPSLDNSIPEFWSASIDYQGDNGAGDPVFASPGTGCLYVVPELTITEIMYNPPEEGADSTEFIEILNDGVGTINLNGYHFSAGVEYTFSSLSLVPGERVVVAKDQDAFLNTFGMGALQWTSGELDDDGETIELRDDFGNLIDIVPYDNEAPWPTEPDGNGPSLTFCYPDLDNAEGENWSASTEFAAINAAGDTIWASPYEGCTFPEVYLVITEIMYNPPEGGTDSLEYIEIYNNGDDAVDMEGFYFGAGVVFEFPALNLNPEAYVVVAVNSEAMMNTFGVDALQWTSGGLSNGGELIELRDMGGNIVDDVNYDDSPPWPTEPDGNGPSLTFCYPDEDNSLGENWLASIEFAAVNAAGDSIFGTPGAGCGEAAPTANFIAEDAMFEEGNSTSFSDLSTGDPTSWLWTFEGGAPGTSTDQNPANIMYNTPGMYDVTLVATNEFGDGTEVKMDYITVLPSGSLPVADFEANPTMVVTGSPVDFTDLSTGDPYEWYWEFEGGSPGTSTEINPQNIVYNTPGMYDVSLTITNEYGQDTEIKIDYITVSDPIYYDLVITEIMYNPPEIGDDTLEFIEMFNNDVVTIDMEGFYFSVGVDYTFPEFSLEPGEFVLVAINSNAIMNTFGVESFQWTDGGLNNGGEPIEIKDSFGVTQDYVEYDDEAPWPTEPDGQGPSLTLCNPNDDNEDPLYWSASTEFIAINSAGDTIWASPLAGCGSIPPIADFYATETILLVGEMTDFVDLTLGEPETWSWTFEGGEPGTSTTQDPMGVQYNEPGMFTVTLEVTNQFGTDTKIRENYIAVGYVPEADFEADNTQISAGEMVTFTDLSTNDPATWSWTFEGGEPLTSTEENPEVYYNMAGDYDVVLTVTNIFGESTEVKTEYIHVAVGIGEPFEDLISVYPNPNSGKFNIETGGNVVEYEVYSIVGELVYKNTTSSLIEEVNIEEHGKGLYFIRILDVDTGEMMTTKLVIN